MVHFHKMKCVLREGFWVAGKVLTQEHFSTSCKAMFICHFGASDQDTN